MPKEAQQKQSSKTGGSPLHRFEQAAARLFFGTENTAGFSVKKSVTRPIKKLLNWMNTWMHLYMPKVCPKPKSQTQVQEKKVNDHPVKNSHRPLKLQDRTCHSVKTPTHNSQTQYDIQNTQNLSTELILSIYCASFFACKNRIATWASLYFLSLPTSNLHTILYAWIENVWKQTLRTARKKYQSRSHTPRAIKKPSMVSGLRIPNSSRLF